MALDVMQKFVEMLLDNLIQFIKHLFAVSQTFRL